MSNPNDKRVNSVTHVSIDGLFGRFDYEIDFKDRNPVILYGDNGCGKTTILNLLVHLLSPEPFEGHRTALASTRFKGITVTLADNTVVSATREAPTNGVFAVKITNQGKSLVEYEWLPEPGRGKDDPTYQHLCKALEQTGIIIHFLSDSRKVLSFQRSRKRRFAMAREYYELSKAHIIANFTDDDDDDDESWLQKAVKNALQAVRSLTLAGTNRGYESANANYTKILSRLVSYEEEGATQSPTEIRQLLLERLEMLRGQNAQYATFGLTSPLDVADLETLMQRSKDDRMVLVAHILSPYLDGIQARLDALRESQNVAASFSSLMSDFYHDKSVLLHLAEGITVRMSDGEQLNLNSLSSGEQQLMLLMCNAISARRTASILAIDEPELSLNVKWQRKLVHALLECVQGAHCQLLLATHSIELLAQYQDNVIPLSESQDGSDDTGIPPQIA